MSSIPTDGFAAKTAGGILEPYSFERRPVGSKDVHIRIKYCGICHSDIHASKGEWGPKSEFFPMVPGHEIVGIVESVGADVRRFKRGDAVGVGCLVDSCENCNACSSNEEMLCPQLVPCYGGRGTDGAVTQGGYSKDIVVKESFVLKIPDRLAQSNFAATAPLLCAGLTCYSPMVRWGMNVPGKKIGVIGLGGLGHMAVKLGVAFGNEVTVISSNSAKELDAKEWLNAKYFVESNDTAAMESFKDTLHFIINTVSAPIADLTPFLAMLKPGGVFVTVGLPSVAAGAPSPKLKFSAGSIVARNIVIAGSKIGGLQETQDMLDFCGKHNITAGIEVVALDSVNEAFERVLTGDVRFRFVIDMST